MDRLKPLWFHLIWQPLAAIAVMCVVLFFLNKWATSDILWAVGAGSIASTCSIVFAHPSGKTADPQRIIGGYLIAICTGEIINVIALHFPIFQGTLLGTANLYAVGLLAALTVGIVIFLMALFNFEHPPATGMALVLVLDIRDYHVLIVVFCAALLLAAIRAMFKSNLRDLLE